MSDSLFEADELDQLLTKIHNGESEVDREREALIRDLKNASTSQQVINALRAGYLGETSYNFYLSNQDCIDLLMRFLDRRT